MSADKTPTSKQPANLARTTLVVLAITSGCFVIASTFGQAMADARHKATVLARQANGDAAAAAEAMAEWRQEQDYSRLNLATAFVCMTVAIAGLACSRDRAS